MIISIRDQTLHLHPLRAIYWEEERTLLIADLHLGKAAHFRKQGLAAPAAVSQTNFGNLKKLLAAFAPAKVLILGDLFHSSLNKVWNKFADFIQQYPTVSFELVKGNHDILPASAYENTLLKIHLPPLEAGPFIFSHYPLEDFPDDLYNFYGHLHPGVYLEGWGGQNLKLPCFHFTSRQAVLPAFGSFTGLSMMATRACDRVFVIAEDEVMEVS